MSLVLKKNEYEFQFFIYEAIKNMTVIFKRIGIGQNQKFVSKVICHHYTERDTEEKGNKIRNGSGSMEVI